MWDVFAWVGIATLAVLALRILHFVVESFVVARIGWDALSALGLWRSIPFSLRRKACRHHHLRHVVEQV